MTEGTGRGIEDPSSSGEESLRMRAARLAAQERLRRQRGMLRPLGWAVALAVVVGGSGGSPAPALHGKGLGVTLALAVFVVTLAIAIRDRFTELAYAVQASILALMGAAGVALAWLQPKHATELAAGAAVWIAVARLPLVLAAVLGAAITIALDIATAAAGSGSNAVFAATLLCVLLGLIAWSMKQARESQDRTETLLAHLEDAREEQTRAAAIAERGRIAGELHDVLAHSLSAAAIQLQGTRMLAEREQLTPEVTQAIDRASELVRDGLASARQAVGALRGDELPGAEQLPSLVENLRNDMRLEVTLRVEGEARSLTPEAGLALYRSTQEALTNVGRYAPGAKTEVLLSYERERVRLSVEDQLPAPARVPAPGGGLGDVGGGRGLASMRERVLRAGGTMHAGPTGEGWRVELDLPA